MTAQTPHTHAHSICCDENNNRNSKDNNKNQNKTTIRTIDRERKKKRSPLKTWRKVEVEREIIYESDEDEEKHM